MKSAKENTSLKQEPAATTSPVATSEDKNVPALVTPDSGAEKAQALQGKDEDNEGPSLGMPLSLNKKFAEASLGEDNVSPFDCLEVIRKPKSKESLIVAGVPRILYKVCAICYVVTISPGPKDYNKNAPKLIAEVVSTLRLLALHDRTHFEQLKIKVERNDYPETVKTESERAIYLKQIWYCRKWRNDYAKIADDIMEYIKTGTMSNAVRMLLLSVDKKEQLSEPKLKALNEAPVVKTDAQHRYCFMEGIDAVMACVPQASRSST